MLHVESIRAVEFRECVPHRRFDVRLDFGPVHKECTLGEDCYCERRQQRVDEISWQQKKENNYFSLSSYLLKNYLPYPTCHGL